MYETEYTLIVRAAAPLDIVWDELGMLERVLQNIPTVSSFEVDPEAGTPRSPGL